MRIMFMGTGEIALPCLRALLDSDHEICALVTQPDRPVGRHQELHAPAPKRMAQAAGVPVLQPERLRGVEAEADMAELLAFAPDLIVVMAYGQILPRAVLELPTVACINVHASLLPRHRGAACIQAPLVQGDEESGVTIMHVAAGLDTGDVILREALVLGIRETGGELHDRLAVLAPSALMAAIAQLEEGTADRLPQEEALASYSPKLLREHGRIDWNAPASELERLIRAYDPWPGTFTQFRDGRGRERRLKIFPPVEVVGGDGAPGLAFVGDTGDLHVSCGDGCLRLGEVQAEGSRRMVAKEFALGHGLGDGGHFF